MILFPITKPRSGLYISPSRLCVADIHRSFRQTRLVEYREHPVPANCLDLIPSKSNISNPDQLLPILQSFFPEKQRPKSVAVCLPDVCARTGVFDFSELPKKKEEQQSLIGWRIEKDLGLSTATARVSYQVYSTPSRGESSAHTPTYRVVATALHHSVIESYEALCLQAGLVPMSISLASLSAFDLCHTLFDTTVSLVSQKVELLPEQRILIYLADWGFTVLIFRDDCPAFIRIKPMRASPIDIEASTPTNSESAGHDAGTADDLRAQLSPPKPSAPTPKNQISRAIANELIGTMQFYFEAHPISAPAGSMVPVLLCGSLSPDSVLTEISNIIDKEFPTAGENEEIGIKTLPVMPSNGSLSSNSLFGLTAWTSHTLPTLGTVMAAS